MASPATVAARQPTFSIQPPFSLWRILSACARSVSPAASLFPPENAVGSYVKIVQRVPVKILFDDNLEGYNIVPGMSVVPKVKIK